MANLHERLEEMYPEKKPSSSPSWIPRKENQTPQEKLKKEAGDNEALSKKRAEDLLVTEQLLTEAKEEIFMQVEDFLKAEFGEGEEFQTRFDHFSESFANQYERHGEMMVWAIGEMLEEMEFINHAGFIIKEVMKERIEEIKKRAKRRQ